MGGRGKKKFPKKKKKNRDQGKKNWEGGREKIKLQKETEIRAEKGQTKKKSTWDGAGIEKRNLSVHHPSTLVHWWVLVHSGRESGLRKCVPTLQNFIVGLALVGKDIVVFRFIIEYSSLRDFGPY